MATYDETRDSEQLRRLNPAIDMFIARCKNPPPTNSDCARQTVFLFPGGMASELSRARTKYVDGPGTPPTFKYDKVWVVLDTPFGGARHLKMHRDTTGTFRDSGDRIIVADASLTLLGWDPYAGFAAWCADNNADLFIFPWDWRRRLDEAATFFVGKFLPAFRTRVQNAGCPDPLARFALVGHSSGGMVVNLILRGNHPIIAGVTSIVTVATPFYGYAGQVHRWFEGEPILNGMFPFPPNVFKQDLMETIASLPGLYALHFLDGVTYDNGANHLALTVGDADFPLPDYPSMDATISTLRADPYNPQTNGSLVRYPTLTGFSQTELDYARVQFQYLASPMDPTLVQKFYNVRGVRTELDSKTPIRDTAGCVTWQWIATNFDASDPTPICNGMPVPGDDTQPAWTTRLATNDPTRWITVLGFGISHMDMMNEAPVLDGVATILCAEAAAVSPDETPQTEPASEEELLEFLQWLGQNRRRIGDLARLEDPTFRKFIPPKFRNKLPALGRRFMMDVLKRPEPKALSELEGDAPARKVPTPATSREAPRRRALRQPVASRARRKASKKKTR